MTAPRGFLGSVPQLLAAAATCALGFLVLLVIAYRSQPGAALDAVALDQFSAPLQRPLLARAARDLAQLADPAPFAVLAATVCALALAARGIRHACGAAVLLAGANLSTQLLKPILAEPRGTLGGWILGPEAFPSGHATASMSLAMAAVIASPRVVRPLAVLVGATFAIGVGLALVAIDAHFPSDVAGGYLMAGIWCFAVLAALSEAQRRWPHARAGDGERSGLPLAAIAVAVALAVAAALAALRLPGLVGYARGHAVFTGVAAGTAVLGTALVAAVAMAAGQPAASPSSTSR